MLAETSSGRELRFAGAAAIRGLRPINGQLLIRIQPTDDTSGVLIAVPSGCAPQSRRPRKGTVVARSAPRAKRPFEVDVGDVVLFPPNCGHGLRLRINGHEHVLVHERDVLAVVDDVDEKRRVAS